MRPTDLIAFFLGSVAVAAEEGGHPAICLTPHSMCWRPYPPAPAPNDARARADRAIFRATRVFQGTPRWDLATNDVKLSPADMMRDYSCAVGISLTPENAPRTASLIRRAAFDAVHETGIAKDFYKRERPFRYDRGPTASLRPSWPAAMIIPPVTPRSAGPGPCC